MSVHRLIFVLLLVSSVPLQAAQFTIEIQGSRRNGEGHRATFAAVVPDRPVRSGPDGYSPVVPSEDGAILPIEWEVPVEYTWDFGDGSPTVTIADLSSVMHVYEANGTYTVRVEARAEGERIGEASHQIEVRNRAPWDLEIAATAVEPETQTFELTAHASGSTAMAAPAGTSHRPRGTSRERG